MRIPRNPKQYELTNHLGNVLSTVLDRKTPITTTGGSGSSTTITHYEGDVVFATDYYPFGSPMSWSTPDSSSGRMYTGGGYRYGFNGKEKDDKMVSNYYDFGARIYDARIGRWLSVDALTCKFPEFSPYYALSNNPIITIDRDGNEGILSGSGTKTDPYIITAHYAYVEGSLNEIELKALNSTIATFNNDGKARKTKDLDGNPIYVKFQLSAFGLPENTVLNNDTKYELRYQKEYWFVDVNGFQRSSLNFIIKEDDPNANDEKIVGHTTGRIITIPIKNMQDTREKIHIWNQKNAEPPIDEPDYTMAIIYRSMLLHEILHTLGLNDNQIYRKNNENIYIQTRISNL